MKSFATLLCGLAATVLVHAHGLTFTRVEAVFARPGEVDLTIDYNLALVLPGSESYFNLTRADAAAQRAALDRALPEILGALELYAGDTRLQPELTGYALPQLPEAAFTDPAVDKSARLRFRAKLPAPPAPLLLVVPYGAKIDHPVLFAASVPATGSLNRTWVEEGPSEPFDWTGAPAPRPPWPAELWTYLKLGFRHIVPEGADHILFVLALFFLGLQWRKLIAQTTVFTIAHATTLFLSRYGVISVSPRLVEPLIAFSIACIALENIYRPKLGPARLALVFAFGLVHGLGFASSLNEVHFPEKEFFVALLGFNFGVDFGQLFIIALAFLAVGWFREKPWFRDRVVVPGCLAIAALGLFWAGQRVLAGWFGG